MPPQADQKSIKPGQAPGGLVFMVCAGGRVWATDLFPETEGLEGVGPAAEAHAAAALELAERYGECRVYAYDGDTGECVQTILTTDVQGELFPNEP